MILVTKWFGVFLCEGTSVKRHILFEKDPKAMAKKLAAVQKGEILPEEKSLAMKRIKVSDPRLSKLGKPMLFDSSFIKPQDYGLAPDLMQKVMVELGKIRTREPLSEDKCVAQAIRATDDLIETINLMSERLHEWYGLHFPELADYAFDAKYAELVSEGGEREEVLKKLQIDLESVGSEMNPEDLAIIRAFGSSLYDLYKRKEELDKYILDSMQKVAPNLTALLSANLAARMISLSGGLGRLAKLPASTVQLLGAEKALFLHLKTGKRPPKHGIIFQHQMVNRAPYWQRGKVARSLGAKASIAAKVDFYKGEFMGDKLVADMEARVEEIKRKYPDPPRKSQARFERPERGGPRGKVYKSKHN
ncbi:MAG: putative NOP5 family protein [Methanomassiliicoccales archaeon PtaU1.Bin124]|nr:MAG: putative NOP5 family protein [Methanomassiliicoccales archaeon PtaU1.Bin124]